jgi:hypothetical protein
MIESFVRENEIDSKKYYPPDVYREPQWSFPRRLRDRCPPDRPQRSARCKSNSRANNRNPSKSSTKIEGAEPTERNLSKESMKRAFMTLLLIALRGSHSSCRLHRLWPSNRLGSRTSSSSWWTTPGDFSAYGRPVRRRSRNLQLLRGSTLTLAPTS